MNPHEQKFFVSPVDYQAELPALRAVREAVFVHEQGVPLDLEWDDLDPRSVHVLARSADGSPIGTGRLTPERKIGRMAVLADWRGCGVGAALLLALLEQAHARGWTQVSLHAQVAAIPFYRRYGFQVDGEEFVEAGIRHRVMRLALAPPTSPPRPPSDLPTSVPLRAMRSADDALAVCLSIIAGARARIGIFSRDLDPELLARTDVLDALRAFATGNPHARVHILLIETERVSQDGHPLLALAQRLSSRFEIRSPIDPIDRQIRAEWMFNDRGGVLYRANDERDGEASPCAPGRARQLASDFDPIWERSRVCSEFRVLGI